MRLPFPHFIGQIGPQFQLSRILGALVLIPGGLIPAWRVGDRSSQTAHDLCADLATRFNGTVHITSDGHPAYKMAEARMQRGRDIVVRTGPARRFWGRPTLIL